MNRTTVLWLRLMTAAQKVGRRRGWKAAQRVLRAWQQWRERQQRKQQKPAANDIDARLRAIFRPSTMGRKSS